jgi:hypothetical protein
MPTVSHSTALPLAYSRPSSAAPALTGVFLTLLEQHRRVLEALRTAGSLDAPAKRQERWLSARGDLLSHERAEHQVIYRRLEDQPAAHSLVDQHRLQADELETAIAELDAVPPGSELWLEKLDDLLAMLDDHVRDEEHDFFPAALALIGERAANDLDAELTRVQRELRHALAPTER